jgi:RHS repeat-associated protein
MGRVKSRTNGIGNTTKYEHNALEQSIETIDPLERRSKGEYDAAGNLKKTEDALGRTISYTYDAADRLKEVNYSEEATHDVAYKYDKDGNVTEMTDGIGTTTRAYDQLDRLTEVKNGKSEAVKYKYDLGSQQTEITYPNGETVKRAFDKAGRLEKVTDWLGKETTFAYNRDSQIKATTFPATTTNVDEFAYNRADQLAEVSMKKGAAVLASMTYTRDKIGQLEKDVETGFPEVPEYTYEYDSANRLTKSNGSTFGYDSANNVTNISSTTYTYDKAGQIAVASNATFEYNKLGQRIKETPTGGSATSFTYDQAGNLITSKGPVTENTFKYDGTGLRTTETKGASTYPMFWDVTPGIPLLLRAGNDYFVYGPDGLPFEQITSGSPSYLHHDQLGSTRILTNSGGEIAGTYRYGPNGAFWKFTGTQGTQMGFAGQYRMRAENQLIYLRARTYDPVTAQFLSVDPMVGATGEPYSYAADNPVNGMDPTGLDACSGEDPFGGFPSGGPYSGCPSCPPREPPDGSATGNDPTRNTKPPTIHPSIRASRWYETIAAQRAFAAAHKGIKALAILATILSLGADAPALAAVEGAEGAGVEAVAGMETVESPSAMPNFNDPTQPPGPGWEWRGSGEAGTSRGSWWNPETQESLHPDLGHPDPHGPHYDWQTPDGRYRVFPDGRIEPKDGR